MIWIIVLIIIIVIALAIMHTRETHPTIEREYREYLRSGQKTRIPFEIALRAWNRDARRWASRNRQIPGVGAGGPMRTRVCSWNVHSWTSADGMPVDVKAVMQVLRDINPDVLCLQEYQPNRAPNRALDAMFPYKFVEMITTHRDRAFGNTIYSKTPLTDMRVIDLPVDPDVGERRICQVVRIKGIQVYNVHLEVRSSYPDIHKYRYPQIDAVLRDARDAPGDNGTIVIGDFNAGCVSRKDRRFHEHIRRQGFASNMSGVGSTNIYGGFVDHAYTIDPVCLMGAYVYVTNISDHYPIIADVQQFVKSEKPYEHIPA
jgi:endonuclease/exonuclease/phosphatase family metal-dependent hydrolase